MWRKKRREEKPLAFNYGNNGVYGFASHQPKVQCEHGGEDHGGQAELLEFARGGKNPPEGIAPGG